MSNFTVSAQATFLYNRLENYSFEIIATSRDLRVNSLATAQNLYWLVNNNHEYQFYATWFSLWTRKKMKKSPMNELCRGLVHIPILPTTADSAPRRIAAQVVLKFDITATSSREQCVQ